MNQGKAQMNSAPRNYGLGRLRLHHDPVSPDCHQAHRDVTLQASPDGRTAVLVEIEERYSDHHATGPEQEVRYEISVSDLVQLIRAHGARL
jgi:predicted transcriptional regulator